MRLFAYYIQIFGDYLHIRLVYLHIISGAPRFLQLLFWLFYDLNNLDDTRI